MIRLISFVKTQIQMNLFEFSCQSKNSNQFAGFFLSKPRCKCIYLILPVKTQNSTQFSRLFLSKSTFDLKKYDKWPVNIDKIDFFCQNTNSNEFIWIFMSKQKSNQFDGFFLSKNRCKWIYLIFYLSKPKIQLYFLDFYCQIWFEKV